MKKLKIKYTLWAFILSVLTILIDLSDFGFEDNLILKISNFPLYIILKLNGFTLYKPMQADHSFYFNNLFLWYRLHLVTYVLFGLLIDFLRLNVYRKVQQHKTRGIKY